MEFTTEMLEKAKTAKTAEELLEMAKAENVEMTAEEAARYFADLHKTGELSDDELDNVSAGCGAPLSPTGKAKDLADVQYLYSVGQPVKVICEKTEPYQSIVAPGYWTCGAKIVDIGAEIYSFDNCYYPKYKVLYKDSLKEEWIWQNQIEP